MFYNWMRAEQYDGIKLNQIFCAEKSFYAKTQQKRGTNHNRERRNWWIRNIDFCVGKQVFGLCSCVCVCASALYVSMYLLWWWYTIATFFCSIGETDSTFVVASFHSFDPKKLEQKHTAKWRINILANRQLHSVCVCVQIDGDKQTASNWNDLLCGGDKHRFFFFFFVVVCLRICLFAKSECLFVRACVSVCV